MEHSTEPLATMNECVVRSIPRFWLNQRVIQSLVIVFFVMLLFARKCPQIPVLPRLI